MPHNNAGRVTGRTCSSLAALATLLTGLADARAGDELARLADRLDSASGRFHAVADEDIESARRSLAAAATALRRAIGVGTKRGASWAAYLRWGGVQRQLSPGEPLDLNALQLTIDRLNSGAPGLERPEPRAAAEAASRLLQLGLAARSGDSAAYLGRQAASLAGYLRRPGAQLDPRASYGIERRLTLLLATGQQPELTSAVEQAFILPNAWFDASQRLLNLIVRRPVVETRPVDDVILGTRVVGDGMTRGRIALTLRPATHAARLEFCLRGSVASDTCGYNGPVVIRSTGETPFCGVKVIDLTDDRFTVLPAGVRATTTTRTRSVNKRGGPIGRRLVEAIARRQVAQSRGRADAIASRKAEQRIAGAFDRQVLAEVRAARREYDDRVRKPLRRRGAGAREVALATTGDRLLVSALLAPAGLLGAGTTPLAAPGGDLSLRLHQSSLNNLADAIVGGATFSKAGANAPVEASVLLPPRLRRWLQERSPGRRATAAARGSGGSAPFRAWSVSLRRRRPISFVVDGASIRILVHTTQITTGEETYRGWDVLARYRLSESGGRWRAEIAGELDVLPTGFDPNRPGARLRSRTRAIRRNLAKQLSARTAANAALPRSIDLGSIDLSAANREGLAGLRVTRVEAERGWLSASLEAF